MDGQAIFAQDPERYYPKFLENSIRPDGRKLIEARKPQGRRNVISRMDGSATASLGKTMAVCAIRGEIGTPEDGRDGKGRITVNVTVTPGCGLHVKDADMITFDLSTRIQQLIEDPKVIDTSNLLIKTKEAFWIIRIDIVFISLDGNSLDAAMLATLLALKHTTLPALDKEKTISGHRYVISTSSTPSVEAQKIQLLNFPITVTLGFLGKYWVCDPTSQEESVMDANATITTLGGTHTNCILYGACNLPAAGNIIVSDASSDLRRSVAKIIKKWSKWLEDI